MKLTPILLGGSLALNAALLALFVAGSLPDKATGDAASPKATHIAPAKSAADATDPASWTNLHPADLPSLLQRLRAEGFPPATIRALLADQVRAHFAARRAALNLKANERPFWEPTTPDAATAAALAQITKEQNQMLKDLLGPDALLDDAATTALQRQFPNLSAEKIAAIQQAQQTRNEKSQEILANLSGGASLSAELANLDKEQRAEIAQSLTPLELEDYELRTSTTANTLRRQLAAFDPTEQEFRTLFQLQKPFDDQYQITALGGMATDEQRQLLMRRAEAQKQLTEQIKTALGDQRYTDYQRSLDNNYQQTSKLVTRLELPPETANQVYLVQQDLQQRAVALQTNRALAPEDRNAQLATLAAEAQTKVTSVLGPRGYEAYKQYGGSWLQQLQPRPTAPARPATGGGGGGGGRGGL